MEHQRWTLWGEMTKTQQTKRIAQHMILDAALETQYYHTLYEDQWRTKTNEIEKGYGMVFWIAPTDEDNDDPGIDIVEIPYGD